MSRKSLNNPQTFDEMVAYGEDRKANSKLYKAENAKFIDSQLSEMINAMSSELITAGAKDKISLGDLRAVKEQTILYLGSCAKTATIPSIAGLARALGTTRRAIYDYINRNAYTESAIWLEQCKDLFSDILSGAGLRGCCNPVVAIFLQKAQFGLRETSTLEITPARPVNPLGPIPTPEEMERRLAELPED